VGVEQLGRDIDLVDASDDCVTVTQLKTCSVTLTLFFVASAAFLSFDIFSAIDSSIHDGGLIRSAGAGGRSSERHPKLSGRPYLERYAVDYFAPETFLVSQ
jgi:hypothetical protein